MLKFFDYLFYRACKFYDKGKDQSTAMTGALVILVLMQVFNLLSVFSILQIIIHKKYDVHKLLIVVGIFLLLIVNGIRYNKLDYAFFKGKWDNNDGMKKRGNFLILYLLLSTILFFGLAIYLGTKNY